MKGSLMSSEPKTIRTADVEASALLPWWGHL